MTNTLKEVAITIPPTRSEIDRKTNRIYCCAGFCVTFVACLFLIPFIVLDLHIAYSSDDCVSQEHFITLKRYLEVSGYFAIGSLVYFFIFTYYVLKIAVQIDTSSIIGPSVDNKLSALVCLTILNKTISAFGLAWAVVGGVLYWRDVTGCNRFTNDYMYARLIISYVFYGYDLIKKENKQQPQHN